MLHSCLVLLFIFSLFAIWPSIQCAKSHLDSFSYLDWLSESFSGSPSFWQSILLVRPYSDGSASDRSRLGFWFNPLPPFFLLGIGSSRYTMVLTSCGVPSNLMVLPRFVLPPDQACWWGWCLVSFLDYSLITLHSFIEFPGPCNKHVYFAPTSPFLGWPEWFFLRLPKRRFFRLVGKAASLPLQYLPLLTRLDSALVVF